MNQPTYTPLGQPAAPQPQAQPAQQTQQTQQQPQAPASQQPPPPQPGQPQDPRLEQILKQERALQLEKQNLKTQRQELEPYMGIKSTFAQDPEKGKQMLQQMLGTDDLSSLLSETPKEELTEDQKRWAEIEKIKKYTDSLQEKDEKEQQESQTKAFNDSIKDEIMGTPDDTLQLAKAFDMWDDIGKEMEKRYAETGIVPDKIEVAREFEAERIQHLKGMFQKISENENLKSTIFGNLIESNNIQNEQTPPSGANNQTQAPTLAGGMTPSPAPRQPERPLSEDESKQRAADKLRQLFAARN